MNTHQILKEVAGPEYNWECEEDHAYGEHITICNYRDRAYSIMVCTVEPRNNDKIAAVLYRTRYIPLPHTAYTMHLAIMSDVLKHMNRGKVGTIRGFNNECWYGSVSLADPDSVSVIRQAINDLFDYIENNLPNPAIVLGNSKSE
jgi:hypothetical protein